MPKIKSPETFAPNQVLTAAAQQNHVDGSYPLPGFITEHSSLAVANTLANDDKILFSDTSDSANLKKANISEILNSGLSLTTGTINANFGQNIVINPAAGFVFNVNGALTVSNAATINGVLTLAGNLVTNGAVSSSTGTNTFTGNVIVGGSFTSNGTANFTGELQVNGTAAYVLYEVLEETIAKFTATNNSQLYTVHTTASFTKPSAEIWVVEVDFMTLNGTPAGACHWRLTDSTDTTSYAVSQFLHPSSHRGVSHFSSFVIASGTSYTGTFLLKSYNIISGLIFGPNSADFSAHGLPAYGSINKFRIYKYKTA